MKAELPARPGLAGLLFLLGGTLLLLRPLAAFWSANENYAYGWGVPFLAAYLLIERWWCRPDPRPMRPNRRMLAGLGLVAFAWALGFIAVRLVAETEPASRPLLWVDGCLAAGAWLAWFGLLGGRPWCRHFAVPVLFVLAGVPWIFRCEFFVTQGLMRLNAAWVAGSLTWLDVPAHAVGNTIMLSTGQLGVTEACSGIRSLQAALMLALFFGEFYRWGAWGRGTLLGMGAGLALLGNYVRMLFLAWRGAHRGMTSVESAHDSAGWLILGFTVVSLWLICLVARPSPALSRRTPRDLPPLAQRMALRWAVCILVATFFAEAATQSWYGWRERSAPALSHVDRGVARRRPRFPAHADCRGSPCRPARRSLLGGGMERSRGPILDGMVDPLSRRGGGQDRLRVTQPRAVPSRRGLEGAARWEGFRSGRRRPFAYRCTAPFSPRERKPFMCSGFPISIGACRPARTARTVFTAIR